MRNINAGRANNQNSPGALVQPDLAIHRLIREGALHTRKTDGRLAFDKSELERGEANGDQKRGRSCPRKLPQAQTLEAILRENNCR